MDIEERKINKYFFGLGKTCKSHGLDEKKPVGVAIMHGLLYMENAYINMAYSKRTKSKLEHKNK